jgi:hypothetical protein
VQPEMQGENLVSLEAAFKREEALRATEEVLDSNGIKTRCSADLINLVSLKGK